jgi:FixJ family two-component response regulator
MNGLSPSPVQPVALQVLVVDDEPVIVEELMDFFAEEGIAAISACDAATALRALKDAGPGAVSVILTDVKMPGQDGLSFAQGILGVIPERDAVEVIVMTGHGSFGMAIDALRSRVFDFLRKPVKLTELNAAIARAHEAAQARRIRAREDEANSARLREMTLVLSARAEAVTHHVRNATDLPSTDVLETITRELRNPLVPVVGLAELIEENAAVLRPAQIVEYAGLIRQAGWQLTHLIEAIEVASASAKASAGMATPQNVCDITAALALTHGAEARRSGMTLEIAPPPSVEIAVNRVCLMLALDQMITDAIRRGRPGQTIRIETAVILGDLMVRVSDEGHPNAVRQNPRGAADGYGLTLRLADRMAQVLGGSLVVLSPPGGPNTASLVLPLRAGPAAA